MGDREGVVKYELAFSPGPAPGGDALDVLSHLIRWRTKLHDLKLIGQHRERYDGLGYGNVSVRSGSGFLISGTQTGGLRILRAAEFSRVTGWNIDKNQIMATGQVKPSSESLTHAAAYAGDSHTRFVLHGHSPEIWALAQQLHLPSTRESVAYGTPAMAREVIRLIREQPHQGVLIMGGHQDGIMAFGADLDLIAGRLVDCQASALALATEIFTH